ncbi:MAG: alpha/beta hydrolase [Acidimicrobiales bacterium]|nr:alpha/beta hydrolase [Acidimicrobiales bacterium]
MDDLNRESGDVTVVLVHGAWHGSWCWEHVTPLLDAGGVAHVEVDLPFTGHEHDVAVTRSVLDGVAGPKVLVGHSYGGLVISGAGEGRSDLAHLVYLCAFMPDRGETIFDSLSRVEDLPHAKVLDAIRTHEDGTSSIDPAHGVAAFYERCPAGLADRAIERLRPMHGSSTSATCLGAPWRSVSSTYVLCEQDQAIPIEAQRSMASNATRTVVLDTDHSPFVSRPDETAQLLIDIAHGG